MERDTEIRELAVDGDTVKQTTHKTTQAKTKSVETEPAPERRRRKRRESASKDAKTDEHGSTNNKSPKPNVDTEKRRSSTSKASSKTSKQANQMLNNSFKASISVHEAPYVGSYAKKLFGVFKPICKVNEFIQVEYMKTGFGLVKGYVLVKDLEKVVQNR